MEYICRECTGRTGEEHSFKIEPTPNCCPWCGKTHTVELRGDYWKERFDEVSNE